MASREERAAYIQQAAIQRGIDPRFALRVAMGEGLNSNGVGNLTVGFGSSVSRADVTLVNASTKYSCWTNNFQYSCQGDPTQDGRGFDITATAIAP